VATSLRRTQGILGHEIKFVGRDAELKELWEFLSAPSREPDFRWWLWTGSAGQGKSRLAIELAQQATAANWRCGFLSSTNRYTGWDTWDVSQPTLVIVDHVAHRADTVRDAICALCHSEWIDAPMRFLLLERDFEVNDGWVSNFVPVHDEDLFGFLGSAYCSTGNEMASSLELIIRHLDSPAADETCGILSTASPQSPARHSVDDLYNTLRQIDSKCRPLFAILLARTVAEEGNPAGPAAGQARRFELLQRVLKREFRLWAEHFGIDPKASAGSRLDFEKHLNIAAFASVVGILKEHHFDNLRENHAPVPEIIDPNYLRALTGLADNFAEQVNPLQPDMLGELFVLERLNGTLGTQSNAVTRAETKTLLSLALAHHPRQMLDFVNRCLQDFPQHPALVLLTELRIPEADYDIGLYMDHSVHYGWIAMAAESAGRWDLAGGVFTNLIQHGESGSFGTAFEREALATLATAYHNRGYFRVRMKQHDAAREDFSRAIDCLAKGERLPDFVDDDEWRTRRATYHLGRALNDQVQERWDEAEQDLTVVIDEGEGIPSAMRVNALLTRAEVRHASGQAALAEEDYQEILKEDGGGTEEEKKLARDGLFKMIWNQAVRDGKKGQAGAALAAYARLLRLGEGDPEKTARVMVNRSAIYLHHRQFAPCIEDCSAVIECADCPDDQKVKAIANRGFALLFLGQKERSRADLEALESATKDRPSMIGTAAVLKANHLLAGGDTQGAVNVLTRLLEHSELDAALRKSAEQMLGGLRT
jgi:tetratricopeptide (TPR) repeat protein